MDFDFIRYKVRILQTTAYNVLLFGGECEGRGTVSVQMLTQNSRPFVVVWGSTLDIDALARALTALHIKAPIEITNVFDINSVALLALYAVTKMEEEMPVVVTGRACGAEPITATLDDVLTFICAIATPQAAGLSVYLPGILTLDAALTQCGYEGAVVGISGGLVGLLTFADMTVLNVATLTFNYLELQIAVSASTPLAIIIASDNSAQLDALISLYTSARIATDAQSMVALDVIISMLKKTTLADYDTDKLSVLNTQSLQAIAYIEI